MIAGAAFDLYAAQFGTGDVAHVCGVSRAVIDMWVNRGFIGPTRRTRSATERPRATKRGRSTVSKGRPLFSVRDVFKARLMRVLAMQVGAGLAEWEEIAEQVRNRKIKDSERAIGALAELAEISDTPAMTGEWMWAVARSIERGKPLNIYAYASRSGEEWLFDMHFVNRGEPPCFGENVPHVFIPVSDVFAYVYTKCKKILSIETPP